MTDQATPLPTSPEQLLTCLEELGVAYNQHFHPPLKTVEDSKALRGEMPGGHCKNLFLRNRKGKMWLVVTLEDAVVDLKDVAAKLDAGRLSFGSPDRLMQYLGIFPGAVSPFALVNDSANEVQVVLHKAMMDFDPLNYHPLINDRTIAVAPGDLVRFLEAIGNPPSYIDL